MHPKRKQRLMIVLSIVIGASVAAALVFYALKDNLNLFYPPAEIKAGNAPIGKRIRAGGMVLDNSIKRYEDGVTVEFIVTDYEANLTVVYTGILPDLFAENEGAVVAGIINDEGIMIADEVLAKHDENYMPPEVSETLKTKPETTKPY
jgi:cytochrome c-type biogenesis protein CcmE